MLLKMSTLVPKVEGVLCIVVPLTLSCIPGAELLNKIYYVRMYFFFFFFFFLHRRYFKPTGLLPLGVPFQLSLQNSCFPINDIWSYLLGDQVFAAAGHMFKLHQQLHPSCITSPSLYNVFFHTRL